MADQADEKQAKADGKKKTGKKGGKAGIIVIMVLVGCSIPILLPTFTLCLIGFIPTLVALVVDTDREKSSAACIGAMNAAGVTPFVIDLWTKGQTMENVFQILRESSTWLIMLGAAGVGQLIAFAVPQMLALLWLARSESRLKILKKNLESLKENWGTEVGTTKPIDKIGR